MFLVGLLLSLLDLAGGLRCTDSCSVTYSMNEPLTVPSNCSHITATRCLVKLLFWYDRGTYHVSFSGISFHDIHIDDNRHFVMIEAVGNRFFSYDIHYICKESDDCARTYAEEKIMQMTKHSYNIANIYSDLQELLYDKSSLSANLACFDNHDSIQQCAVPGVSGSCQVVDDLTKFKFHRRLCLHSNYPSASVNVFDSGSVAMMTVRCNRMLCNGPLTMGAVKRILYHHNITDLNGRLPGRSSQIPVAHYLLILISYYFIKIL